MFVLSFFLFVVSASVTPSFTCWYTSYINGTRYRNAVMGYNSTQLTFAPIGEINRNDGSILSSQATEAEEFVFLSGYKPVAFYVEQATFVKWRISETATTDLINLTLLATNTSCYVVFNQRCSVDIIGIPNFCGDTFFCNGAEQCDTSTDDCVPSSLIPCGVTAECSEEYLNCTDFVLTDSPTGTPTGVPTKAPTVPPTIQPTGAPTKIPTASPTQQPTSVPTVSPTQAPTIAPTTLPTNNPTTSPTGQPTHAPTVAPTGQPTSSPTISDAPTNSPTTSPTGQPTNSPTAFPTPAPTILPTTAFPTQTPTNSPTESPTPYPTVVPTAQPTGAPTAAPTAQPTGTPTAAPTTQPTPAPTTAAPTTAAPTNSPTSFPTLAPTSLPTQNTSNPSRPPSRYPITPCTNNSDCRVRRVALFCASTGFCKRLRCQSDEDCPPMPYHGNKCFGSVCIERGNARICMPTKCDQACVPSSGCPTPMTTPLVPVSDTPGEDDVDTADSTPASLTNNDASLTTFIIIFSVFIGLAVFFLYGFNAFWNARKAPRRNKRKTLLRGK